ncbi:MAG: YtxH domain-containing protein [Acidobacteriota bacterium]
MDRSEKTAWLIAGTLVGAAVALLYAPQPGDEARRYLRKNVGKGLREITDQGRAWYEHGAAIADDAADLFDGPVPTRGREFLPRTLRV